MRSADEVIETLRGMASPRDREGMARFGINTDRALGISVTTLRGVAKEVGRDHALAVGLWDSGIHEARLLATMVDDPEAVTSEQMEAWAADFDSWDLCDQCCMNLFWRTPYAIEKASQWAQRDEEFVKRAAFALMARLATKKARAPDELLESFLPIIERAAVDDRNFVCKAVSWALRQVGKSNRHLNGRAMESAERIGAQDTRSARWIANDALRELASDKVQARL